MSTAHHHSMCQRWSYNKMFRIFSLALLLLLWMASSVSSSQAATSSLWNNWRMWWLRAGTTVSNDKQQQKETGISRDATSFPSSSSGAIDDDVVIQAAESRDNEPLPTLSPNDESSSSSVSSTTAAGTDNRQSLLSPTMYNSFRNSTLEATIGIADEILDDDAERLWKTSQIMTSKRRQFLDRIAVISSSLMRREQDAVLAHSDPDVDLEAITPQSDLTLPNRHIHIVTTAALPWFTGTSVNPLLRAAYMHRKTQKINRRSSENSRGGGGNNQRWVTLVIPWLELPEDQEILYGRVFVDCQEQEDFIRAWLRDDAGMADAADAETGLEICFYPARYHTGLGSIFAMGDIMDTVILLNNETSAAAQERQLDVCVLEEPEHCNWYRAPGDGWTKRFNYVVGVVHTNYKEYASGHYSGLWTAPAIALMSSAMVRAYCHKVIKLSNTLQSYAVEKESTSNVHGVRSNFWQEGVRRAQLKTPWATSTDSNATQVYFIGKLLWAKGFDLMLELEDYYKQYTGDYFAIDLYGNGPDQRAIMRAFHGRRNSVNANPKIEDEIEAADSDHAESWETNSNVVTSNSVAEYLPNGDLLVGLHEKAKQNFAKLKETINSGDIQEKTKEKIAKFKDSINSVELPQTFAELRRQPIPATFPGRVDHGKLKDYKIFMNPSISEVLCTTTAEALAMGKFAIIPVHPSNTFFLQFPNCLAYRNKFEFVANLRWALTHDPEPLSEELSRQFTWEAATDRFIAASAISWKDALERERLGLAKLDERIAWFHNELGKGTTGDFLRRVLGGGPASHQVKYQKEMAADATRDENDENLNAESEEDDEDESGFSRKFRRSSFARAISATVGDISSFALQ